MFINLFNNVSYLKTIDNKNFVLIILYLVIVDSLLISYLMKKKLNGFWGY